MKGALVLLLALRLGDAGRVLRSPGVQATGNATVDLEDADAMAKGVEADARADLDDVDAIRRASGLESHRARETLEQASEDEEDGQAIAKADKLWSKAADAQGERDLKDPKDRDALVRAVALEVKAQDKDAAQMQLLASKEQADGDASLKQALSMGADAEVLEHEAMAKLEREGADVSALRAAAATEAGALIATNSTRKVSPGQCHCGCCAPAAAGEKACTAPVGALHSTTKTDMCRTVYCTDPSDTTGAQNQAWSSYCDSSCFAHPEVASTCRPKECEDAGVNVHCQ